MNSSYTNCSQAADVAFVSIYSLLFVVGLPLNLAALWIFFFRGALRSITTIYMKNLAASDLLLLASLPLRVYYYSKRPPLSQMVCEIAGLLLLVNMYSSIFLLTCISWDRCMAVCFPLRPWAQALRRQAKYICAGVWALSILGSIPSYFASGAKGENDTRCFDSRPQYITDPRISSAMVVSFAVPLVIMVTCSCSLLRVVHQSTVVQMKLVKGAKIQHMVVTNVAIFLGCFLPYHLVLLWFQVGALNNAHWDRVYRWALLLACVNATLDPLAYYFATETFQHLVAMDHLFQRRGSHTNHAEGTERLSRPLETQHQSAWSTPVSEAPSCVKAPDLKEASASGPGQL
ncbi:PREDICTED: lysophosphatidic acid receptor 6-like [Gekko japonicus]|uniref:Lysophosphatidic acid receptor 6-like n=1 Tax=Gekko japonicus TaxID=146911 RepID=A0ABM1KF50_GEKJA|nr:PREDICTED: lysophosphatidic acid receptor 6-like [Gekko japonicus]